MSLVNEDRIIREQYKTAHHLNTRISIHDKYSVNKMGFGNWIFSHYEMKPNIEILELGCGNGDMWKNKLDALKNHSKLVLTDFSEGMVAAAKAQIGEHPSVSYDVVNIEDIPYETKRFDIVIANMMLYHVPNLGQGLSEVKRVVKDDGIFYCATYGEHGIVPYIAGLLKDYGVSDKTNKGFTLQNGKGILEKYFSEVQRVDYEDFLEVTNVEDIVDYIYSLPSMTEIANVDRNRIRNVLEKHMVDGVLKVPKEYGMFICRKG